MGLLSGSIGSIKAMERGCEAGENREINLVKNCTFYRSVTRTVHLVWHLLKVSRGKFHQHFTQVFFIQNFGSKNYEAKCN